MWYRPRALSAAARTKLASFASLAWFVVMAGLAALLWLRGVADGGPGLVPTDHRPPIGAHVRLTLQDAEAGAAWAQIVDQLGPRLPQHRPLAAPPTEASAWRGAHLLYLHGAPTTAALAQRLEPTALRDTVAGLRARLASPLFAVGEHDPRRDPLGLTGDGAPADASFVTASGDLLSADGRTLVVYLRTRLPPMRLHAWISAQLAARFGVGSGIDVRVLPITANTRGGTSSTKSSVDLLAAVLAALTLVLALGLRRVRTAGVLVLAVGLAAPLVVVLAGGLGSLDAPLVVVLLAVAVGLAGPIVGAGLASMSRGASALLPLLLLPYPVWQRWALAWLLAVTVLGWVVRGVVPVVSRWVAARAVGPGDGTTGRPWPRTAALVACVALLAGGSWSFGHVSGDILADEQVDAGVEEFFVPARLVELRSHGADAEAALAVAADDAAGLRGLGWADAPGELVVGEARCAARYAELKPIDLPGRILHLRDLLAAQGLRADAFGEALRGLDPEQRPTPEEALAGPLATWFAAHLEQDEDGVAAISRVELPDEAGGAPAGLRGPAVFELQEQRARAGRLGLALAVGAWLAAFLTWLTTRRLSTAITAGLIGAATQAGALLVAVLVGFATLVLVLPPLLIVGALAADLAARVCGGVKDGRPGLALACVLAPALVLVASPEPAWRGFGLVLGVGAGLGFVLANRAAPGLCALLRRGQEGT